MIVRGPFNVALDRWKGDLSGLVPGGDGTHQQTVGGQNGEIFVVGAQFPVFGRGVLEWQRSAWRAGRERVTNEFPLRLGAARIQQEGTIGGSERGFI